MAKASKKKKAEVNQQQTKKQIAFSRKQARQNRIVWTSVIALVAAIVLILLLAVVVEILVKPNEAVATVNGAKIRTVDYQDLLTYRRYNLYVNLNQVQDSLQGIDTSQEGNEFIASFYQSQLEQLQSALVLAPQDVLDELIEDELIREKAEELGITISDAEVQQTIDADLQQAFAAPPAVGITNTEEIPTPTPIPQEQLDELYGTAVKNMGLTDKKFRNLIARSLLRQKVQEHLADQVVTTGLVAHVQLIQTETEEEAAVAQMRVEAGEDFAIVAQEISTDTLTASDGGDLGWVTTGQLAPRYGEDLENAVFAAAVGEMVVVQSGDMYYAFVVVERDENGPLPEGAVAPLQASALDDWLAERTASPDVTIVRSLDADKIPPDPFAVTQGY